MVVLGPKPPKMSISTWPPRDLLDVDACPVFTKSLMSLSRLTRLTLSSSFHVLLLFSAPRGSPVTPPGLLGSLGPRLLAFVLHCPWFIGTNLSLDLIASIDCHIASCLHITSQETSNSYNIVNHSPSRVNHHWSSRAQASVTMWAPCISYHNQATKM